MMYEKLTPMCPLCNHILYKRHEGLVCKNWKCKMYFKLEKGWVYFENSKKSSDVFFLATLDFDITSFENRKKWLELKAETIYEKGKCEICKSNRRLEIHHILYRSDHPELTFDKENLMVLCKNCHIGFHKKDKHTYSKGGDFYSC